LALWCEIFQARVIAKANTFMTIRGGWLNLATRADTCRRRTLIDEAKKPDELIADKRCKLVS
jgi:hypothetical protein